MINYKNFDTQSFEFDAKINCFVGPNGIGKTNVLDAIYHLSYGKSYFNPISSQNIRHESDFFVIDGLYEKDEKEEQIMISFKKGQKKHIKRNGKLYDRFSDHIGFIPLVIISPSDRDLILEGSDVRRRFMDSIISQGNNDYLKNLIDYNQVVSQRNALLKYFALNNTFNKDQLETYDHQLVKLGIPLHRARIDFVEHFKPIFERRYESISGGNEKVELIYRSNLLEEEFLALLQANHKRDRIVQYTGAGIHKDDLLFRMSGYPVKKFGSQGQQKSFLIALKLAQFDFLKAQNNMSPILLLDDIFDKLDEHRVAQIINLVDEEQFGQLFISDTHPERTEAAVQKVHQSYKFFNLRQDENRLA